jgi:hypothetical protein
VAVGDEVEEIVQTSTRKKEAANEIVVAMWK